MKRFFLLLLMLFMVFGVYEIKAMPTEQKVYVPDIVVSYDIDLSYGLDAATLGFTFTDIVGENIRILYGDVTQQLFTGDKATIQVNRIEGYSNYRTINAGIKNTQYIDIRLCYTDRKDYSLLGYGKRVLYRLGLIPIINKSKDYTSIGYSIKY